jgi:hypothetical protein
MSDVVGVEMTSEGIHHIDSHRNGKPTPLFLNKEKLLVVKFLFSVQR